MGPRVRDRGAWPHARIEHHLGGIEERGQFRRLHELGCEYGQGYLFSRPQEADAMIEMLMAERPQRGSRQRTENGLRPAAAGMTVDHIAS